MLTAKRLMGISRQGQMVVILIQIKVIIFFFFRQGLGTHSVPDIEVLSTDPPDLMPLTGDNGHNHDDDNGHNYHPHPQS